MKNNTIKLQNILEKVNSLASPVKTCIVTISGDSSAYYPTKVLYTTIDENQNIVYKNETCSTSSITVSCLKNSVIACNFAEKLNSTSSSEIYSNLLLSVDTLGIFRVIEDISFHN